MNKKQNDDLKVEWLGIDGAFVLLYVVLAVIYTYGILNRIDWIIGIMAPVVACGLTTAVFIRYCYEVFAFSKKGRSKK